MLRWIVIGITAVISLAAQSLPDFRPPTPLFRAVLGNEPDEVNRLLEGGADPNEARFLGAPALIVSLMQYQTAIAKSLLAKGADVKATDPAGTTSLMWAAANEFGDTEIVSQLISMGVDPNAANKSGDTALVWAMRRGYTPVVRLLKKHGASDRKLVRDSAERAIALLQKSGPEFIKVSGCTSCHHQSLPQMAFAEARKRGLTVDEPNAEKQVKTLIAMFKGMREPMAQGKEGIPDPPITVSYALLGLAAEGYKPDENTAAMAHLVSVQQKPDGSFRVLAARPPLESSAITGAALSIRALQLYGADPEPKVAKAREWLRTAIARTTEERAMKLLGLAWAKAGSDDIQEAARMLLAEQRADGGWAQLPALETDAYATGQSLMALYIARQIGTGDDVYQRGAAFLLRTQRPDGSWLVRSRSFPFQKLKESGFPHGNDQWISASGTSWAAMALTAGLPPADGQLSELN